MAKSGKGKGAKRVTSSKGAREASVIPWSRIALPLIAIVALVVAAAVMSVPRQAAGLAYAVEDGNLVIDASQMSDKVEFLTYEGQSGDANLMVVDDGGKITCRLDTCNSCNGSPKAYYNYSGGKVVCQNCGFDFALNNLDEKKGGCSPQLIDYTVDGSKISISTDDLEAKTGLFDNISRPAKSGK